MKKRTSQDGPLSGLGNAAEKAYVLKVYSLLAFLSLGTFGAYNIIVQPQLALGYWEVWGAILIALNLILFYALHSIVFTRTGLLLIMMSFEAVMLMTGGTVGTGIFWFFMFPVAAFFLAGKRQGLVWMLVLLASILGLWLLDWQGVVSLAYNSAVLRQLIASLVVVTIGIYAYELTRESLEFEKRASQHALESEKLRADEIVQHIGEGIVTTDLQCKVTFMNEAAEKLLGWKLSDLKGKSFVEIVPMLDQSGNDAPVDSRPLYQVLRTGKATTQMATYKRKDGRHMPVSVSANPVVENDKVIAAIGTFRDMSEEQDVARAKSEFVTLASHQLRTPISAISWMSELLLNGDTGTVNDDQKKYLEDIYQSNQRLAALVSEMLLVSSLDLGSFPVVLQFVKVPELASSVVNSQVSSSSEKTAEVVVNSSQDVPLFKCDPDVLRLLLRNLISNAIKYTPKTGHIILDISVDHKQALYAGSQGSLVIHVTDTGYGIPESVSDKIFQKFFRGPNILHRDTDGTGLGLYIVKSLLDYVGGRISFTSREGKGTTFTVLLPLEGMHEHQPQAGSVSKTTRHGAIASASRERKTHG
jgi:PAS domain S-box-containing protein